MQQTESFSLGLHITTLTRLIKEPGYFFSRLTRNEGFRHSFGFLLASGIFFTFASLVSRFYEKPLLMGLALFIGSIGMVVVSASIGYLIMRIIPGENVGYAHFFNIVAHATGASLHLSWIPVFIFVSEPWKWWLIGTGLKKSCGLKGGRVLLIVGLSFGTIALLFGWLLSGTLV